MKAALERARALWAVEGVRVALGFCGFALAVSLIVTGWVMLELWAMDAAREAREIREEKARLALEAERSHELELARLTNCKCYDE